MTHALVRCVQAALPDLVLHGAPVVVRCCYLDGSQQSSASASRTDTRCLRYRVGAEWHVLLWRDYDRCSAADFLALASLGHCAEQCPP